jgi:hypothetical protein
MLLDPALRKSLFEGNGIATQCSLRKTKGRVYNTDKVSEDSRTEISLGLHSRTAWLENSEDV